MPLYRMNEALSHITGLLIAVIKLLCRDFKKSYGEHFSGPGVCYTTGSLCDETTFGGMGGETVGNSISVCLLPF